MRDIIFIGGIHGSGKSVICDQITRNSNLIHLTASKILKWHEISSLKEKSVQNINDTQERLITSLKSIIQPNQRYLLDGHYCLLNKTTIPERIPLSTFHNISPLKLILIIAPPQIIGERLRDRDSQKYTEQLIDEFQQQEIKYADELKNLLQIPLLTINSLRPNMKEIIKYIQ